VREYEDASISGTTENRPGFQQMLSEVAKIRPSTLIMWKTDRLGRDKYVLAMAKKEICDEFNAQGVSGTSKTGRKYYYYYCKAYWEKFLHADLDNPETRDAVMEYFVERVVLYESKVVLMLTFADDLPYEFDWSEAYEEDADPFVKGEAVREFEFDCFPFGSIRKGVVGK